MKRIYFTLSVAALLLNFTAMPLAAESITFADADVKAICVENWDTDGDGELSMEEAAAVTDLGDVFQYQEDISSFNELQYFTGLTSIGKETFSCCWSLSSITIPNSVTSIGEEAFWGCSDMSTVTIKNTTPPSISSDTFDNDTYYYATLRVPENSKETYEAATNWKKFKHIEEYLELPEGNTPIDFADENAKAICVENWDLNGDGELSEQEASVITNLGSVFKYNKNITSFEELRYFTALTSIAENAFGDCNKLVSITIPRKVSSIHYGAFSSCRNLTEISVVGENTIYDSRDNCNAIIRISDNTFILGCKNSVIPNTVTAIADNAFEAGSITDAILPASVTSIGRYNFKGSSSIIVADDNPVYDSRDNCNAIISTSEKTLIAGCKNTVIPNSVTAIADYAFYGCGIVSVTIPGNVMSIGGQAFKNCTQMTSVTIENGVKSIGGHAFGGCTSLRSIHIPSSVNSIVGQCLFAGSYQLASITIADGNAYYDSRDNCNAIIRKADNTLITGCSSTKIPSSVVRIDQEAFHSVQFPFNSTFHIPYGVSSIGIYAFAWGGLKDVSIPESVTIIESNAFSYGLLSSVRVESATPIATQGNVFSGNPLNKLYVPKGSKAAYENTSPWNHFSKIIEIGDANGDDVVSIADVTTIINHINDDEGNFNEAAADVNGDGIISIADVTGVINIINK